MIYDLSSRVNNSNTGNIANAITGTLFSFFNGVIYNRPIELATVRNIGGSSTFVYLSSKTNHNGYYFMCTKGNSPGVSTQLQPEFEVRSGRRRFSIWRKITTVICKLSRRRIRQAKGRDRQKRREKIFGCERKALPNSAAASAARWISRFCMTTRKKF